MKFLINKEYSPNVLSFQVNGKIELKIDIHRQAEYSQNYKLASILLTERTVRR